MKKNKQQNYSLGIDFYSSDMTHPSVKRRYSLLGKYQVEKLIYDQLEMYDVVIINISTNYSLFYKEFFRVDTRKRPKIILDYCDLTILDPYYKIMLRDMFYRVKNKFKGLSHSKAQHFFLRNAHLLVCGSMEQKKMLQSYNKNIEAIPDYVFVKTRKKSVRSEFFEGTNSIKIIWEGFASANQKIFKMIGEIDQHLSKSDLQYEFIFITDLKHSIFSNFFATSTERTLKTIIKSGRFKIFAWDYNTLKRYSNYLSIGLIPIPDSNKRMFFKPENKIILLRSLGYKVIASPIPSYKRIAKRDKNIFLAETIDHFVEQIKKSVSNMKISSNSYTEYSAPYLRRKWMDCIRSICY